MTLDLVSIQRDTISAKLLNGHCQKQGVEQGVRALGHDHGIFYYYSISAKQVYAITAAQHNKNTFMAMASAADYWQCGPWVSDKGKVDWDSAIDGLMGKCRAEGVYDPERVRGRGAWLDGGRAVLHVGDRLIVDGQPSGLALPGSRYIYEAAKPLVDKYVASLPTEEASKLLALCHAPAWQHPISGTLLAGFIAVAPVCGGLAWRPSIWLTGGGGSGKTWVKDNLLAPAMGGLALEVQSKTSEAGIRQTLGSDALPVIFDEAEGEDPQAAARLQGVLDLIRQSSSERGADILKGTQGQTGAKRYRVKSCFALSSINVGIQHYADESRITVLALRDRTSEADAGNAKAFAEINRTVQTVLTPTFAAGLISRSVHLLPIIRDNAETFARAASVMFGSRRKGDQLGALLAGAYSLQSEQEISLTAAEEWVMKLDWGTAAVSDIDRDETRLLSHITQHRIRFAYGNSPVGDVTIGELILASADRDEQISATGANKELMKNGIRYDAKDKRAGIYVSNTHPALKRMLVGTPWAAGWGRSLGRLTGAVTGGKAVRFAFGHIAKATWVPMEAIDQDEA
jgi:putative DNA primase/helicase